MGNLWVRDLHRKLKIVSGSLESALDLLEGHQDGRDGLRRELSAALGQVRRATDVVRRGMAARRGSELEFCWHDMRTALMAILGWSQLMSSGRLDEAGYIHAAEVIARNAKSLTGMLPGEIEALPLLSPEPPPKKKATAG